MGELENIISEQGHKDVVSQISDPFSSTKNIEGIIIRMYKSKYSGKFSCYSTIEFVNNNTSGEHTIKGDSLDDVYIKTAQFVKSIET